MNEVELFLRFCQIATRHSRAHDEAFYDLWCCPISLVGTFDGLLPQAPLRLFLERIDERNMHQVLVVGGVTRITNLSINLDGTVACGVVVQTAARQGEADADFRVTRGNLMTVAKLTIRKPWLPHGDVSEENSIGKDCEGFYERSFKLLGECFLSEDSNMLSWSCRNN
eukprot:TRINITY_DN27581_c0_g1_i1.p1 TRINITY_DN27581_c0_g1~~TRINITY_DN27581_c0_g1_i1.p1  ORF type:complete len:168 (+),score=20.33 TRINITY_DN27581_c0_g1_i1:471-974(+)